MNIYYIDNNRGFSLWPVGIFIPIKHKGTWKEKTYIAHETTHYRRQGWSILWWLIKYFVSKGFRFEEEKIAMSSAIRLQNKLGEPYYPEKLALILSTQYWDMCSYAEALIFTNSLVGVK